MRFSPLALLAIPLATALPTFHPKEPALTTTDLELVTSLLGSPLAAVEGILTSIQSSVKSALEAQADPAEKTIWQLLNEDEDKYSKIVKLIEIDGGAKEVLDNRDLDITFFAPENSGIPDPHHHDDDDDDELSMLATDPSLPKLHAFLTKNEALFSAEGLDKDDDKKEKRKQIFKYILKSVLKYHGLTKGYSAAELAGNKTFETALSGDFGASDGEALRLRVEKKLLPPSLELNFYAKVQIGSSDVKAKNGYLHTIDHPLFPPPSILTAAFLFPKEFSTLTSATQKVHGQKYIEFEIDPEESRKEKKPVFHGSGAVTLFAPTNAAFEKLPQKLSLFLFSPFGEKVLAKILSYHALPKQILFSEHYHVAHHKHSEDSFVTINAAGDNTFHEELSLPSGLNGTELKIVIDKSGVLPIPGATKTSIKVNDVEVETIDVPALNGAIHVIPDVLVPPHKHHKDDAHFTTATSEWENWESWLVDWAASV